MKALVALILGLAGFSGELRAEVCPDTNYTLTTDAELELFRQIGCTRINGTLLIGIEAPSFSPAPPVSGTSITSLSGLGNLKEVSRLTISNNSLLSSLDGLSSDFVVTGALEISRNENLATLDGLGCVNSSNPDTLEISDNPILSNCEAVANAFLDDAPRCSYENATPDNFEGEKYKVENNAPGCNSVDEILQGAVSTATLQVILESPAAGDTYSGVSTLRGWAVAYEGISKVDIYIDGNFFQSAPYGGKRGDVGSIFPEINDSDESGFALAYNFSGLSAGTHTIKVEAVTTQGRVLSRTSQFQVTKFPAPFLPADQSPDLRGASCVINDQTVHILDTLVDGSVYDVSLEWRTADQGFQIQEIR